MSCAICWDKFEDSACSLNCGHLFHRKCIDNFARHYQVCPLCGKGDPTKSHTNDIREVFFTSGTSTSESSCWEDPMSMVARLRQQNAYLLEDKLKEPERLEATATAIGDKAIEAAATAMKNVAKRFEDKLYEFDSERRRWERRAKNSEKEVALLETELKEVQQERDDLKKTIRKLKANISNA